MSHTPPTDLMPEFSRFLKSSLGDLVRAEAQTFEEMLSEDAVIEFPYAPSEGVHRVEGRANIVQYLAGVATLIKIDEMALTAAHHTTTAGLVILEFRGTGSGVATGKSYIQTYISVITTQAGYITHYLDYWNPLVALETMGGAEAIAQAVSSKENS